MSEYYHYFEPGFNYWYVALPVAMAISFIIGLFNYRVEELDDRVRIKNHAASSNIFVVLLAVTLIVMMIIESGSGLTQFFDNCLDKYTSPAYSIIAGAMAWVVIATGVYAALLFFFVLGAKISRNAAREKRKKLLRKLNAAHRSE